ncbi:hypothetical protein BU14_0887s0002 [Porphyra umbilicalis]|uniref:Uncharacterized protein n=1 Tax=Porphyra umbilicalis TaxID=2786 RepID=A0A1X6NNN2_PORUM|nr:hypothetical protein BU14_0887s0002 [Porphyra umbilicalis]|eukprot:OSX70140.1 hypothetical protein BU14_0887s0002 [Porphyra umbilicalis]
MMRFFAPTADKGAVQLASTLGVDGRGRLGVLARTRTELAPATQRAAPTYPPADGAASLAAASAAQVGCWGLAYAPAWPTGAPLPHLVRQARLLHCGDEDAAAGGGGAAAARTASVAAACLRRRRRRRRRRQRQRRRRRGGRPAARPRTPPALQRRRIVRNRAAAARFNAARVAARAAAKAEGAGGGGEGVPPSIADVPPPEVYSGD